MIDATALMRRNDRCGASLVGALADKRDCSVPQRGASALSTRSRQHRPSLSSRILLSIALSFIVSLSYVRSLCSSMMTCCLIPCVPSSGVVPPSKRNMCHLTSLLIVCRRLCLLAPTFKILWNLAISPRAQHVCPLCNLRCCLPCVEFDAPRGQRRS